MKSAAELVQEHNTLDDFITKETKRFAEHLKPTKTRLEEIKNLLHQMLNEQKANSFSTDAGTAYISTIMTPKITDRDGYLKWVLKHWNEAGNEMLQIGAPQKDALKTYMDEHADERPPGVDVSYFNRINVRRS